MNPPPLRFVVTVPAVPGASPKDHRDYIVDALKSWGGSFRPPGGYGEDDPGDPLFGGYKTVVIKRIE